MINHIRTLLLNRAATELTDAGDAYVPPAYTVKSVNGHAVTVRNALFGSAPDRLLMNFRLYQLLKVVRVSTLAAFETRDDSRITYDALLARAFPDVFGAVLVTVDDRVTIVNSETPAYDVDASGVTRHKLRLTIGASTVTWRWLSASRSDITLPKPAASGGTISVSAPPGAYAMLVPDEEGTSWIFDLTYRPTATITDLATALDDAGLAVTELIRGASPRVTPLAPYDTLFTAWSAPETPFDRVAAATIALALRTYES